MPKFVDYSPTDQGMNMTGRSQGFTSPLEVVGKAMKGVAQTASLFMENKQKEDKNAFLKATDTEADRVLSGVPEYATPSISRTEGDRAGRLEDIPAGLQTGLDNFARYAKAYNKSGSGSDLDIYTKLVTSAKQMKARFPQYSDDVDSALYSALGSKPANLIRKELNSLVDAENRKQAEGADSSEKYYRGWAGQEGNSKYIAQAGYDMKTLDFTNENQMRSVQNHVMQMQADDLKTLQTKNKLELDAAVGKADVSKYKDTASIEVGNKVDQALRVGSPTYDEMMKAITASKSPDGPDGSLVSPEEQALISETFGRISSALTNEAAALVNSPFYLKGLTSKEDRADVLNIITERLKTYQDMLDNGMYGLFNGVNNQIKAKYAQEEYKALTGAYGNYTSMILKGQKMGMDMAAIDDAISTTYGPGALVDAKMQAARQFLGVGLASGSIDNLGAAFGKAQEDGLKDPALFGKTTDDIVFNLTNPTSDPKVVDNLVKSVYQSKNNDTLIKQFAGSSKRQIFNKFTDPRIFEKLKGTENYRLAETWAKNQFVGLNKTNIDTVIENQSLIGSGVDLIFDSKVGAFKVILDPKKFIRGPTNTWTNSPGNPEGLPEMGPEFMQAEKLKAAVSTMNSDLMRIHSIVENGDTGLDPIEETKLLLHLGGFNKLSPELQEKIFNGEEEEKGKGKTSDSQGHDSAVKLLTSFEGFESKPYWDVNAWRVGYGSDTITDAKGNVSRVSRGAQISKEDAIRDLNRRIPEFQQTIIEDVGAKAWAGLVDEQKAALTSITYNYGELPKVVVQAVKTGDTAKIKAAIETLTEHNNGINKKRRLKEASFFSD